jgi:hypothetical protein
VAAEKESVGVRVQEMGDLILARFFGALVLIAVFENRSIAWANTQQNLIAEFLE